MTAFVHEHFWLIMAFLVMIFLRDLAAGLACLILDELNA